jgi:hypothetical protein
MANQFDTLDLSTVPHNPVAESLVQIICQKTQNTAPLFYRILVAYYLTKVASMMRCKIRTHDRRDPVPVNLFAVNLATSGFGKGHGKGILEDRVINQFRQRYLEETFPLIADQAVPQLSVKRAARKNSDPDKELEKTWREFDGLGPLAFSFSEATVPAIKQMRHKLLMADAGSVNLEIDEIGLNLSSSIDVLTAYLELFDDGKIGQKLVKNTSDSARAEEIDGRTPTNLLMFGTPSKLFNGGKVEEEFYTMLENGYARRCFFGYVPHATRRYDMSGEELYRLLVDQQADHQLDQISDQLAILADPINFGRELSMTKEVMVAMLEYKLYCERRANQMGEHEEIRRAEMSHRYWKSLKLAGTYAFIEDEHEVTEAHLLSAIKLAEESGKAFEQLLNRDRNYVKLAKYLAAIGTEVTQADLVEVLPFYKGSQSQKQDLLNLAIAYGYKNNIIIRKSYMDGIEFLSGESLKETDLSKMRVAYGQHVAFNYRCEEVPFDQLHVLTQADGFHWSSHHFVDGHRCEEKTIPGFNMVVIDVDGGVSLDTAKLLLKDYKALYYTTKRHTEQENRFRILLPLNYNLKMDSAEYKEFMQNIFEWLPFSVDDSTGQRCRKWLSHNGHYEYNDGELLDALQFIPKTRKNEERKQRLLDQQSLTNLERWFINHTSIGNRSNQLIKYALLLVDSGKSWDEVHNAVLDLNNKLADKLDENEIMNTIMVTAGKAIAKRDAQAA